MCEKVTERQRTKCLQGKVNQQRGTTRENPAEESSQNENEEASRERRSDDVRDEHLTKMNQSGNKKTEKGEMEAG